MSGDVEFTLAVQVCDASDRSKLMLNLLSTLYTGWLRADNMENIKKIFAAPVSPTSIMENMIELGKQQQKPVESIDDPSLEGIIIKAIEFLGGKPITSSDLIYNTEVLVACDLYSGSTRKLLSNNAIKYGKQLISASKHGEQHVLLPAGYFGNIGKQEDYTDIPPRKHSLRYEIMSYKNEVKRLGLADKITSIRLVYPHNNYGLPVMRSIVIQTCKGRLLNMLDDDDISCGLDSLHRIGRTMLANEKYVSRTCCWWNEESVVAVGNSIWSRMFDVHALKRLGLTPCPTFSIGEDDTFTGMLEMLFPDKHIDVTTTGELYDGRRPYPANIDLKYLYLNPSYSWRANDIKSSDMQKQEISLYLIRICKQLGIYDVLRKAIPEDMICDPKDDPRRCPKYMYLHIAKHAETTTIISTGDIVCPTYHYIVNDDGIVKDGDYNIQYVWAMAAPTTNENITVNTNIPATDDINDNINEYNLNGRIKIDATERLVITGKLRPRTSSIDNSTGKIICDLPWFEWNNTLFDETAYALNESSNIIEPRTRLHGGNRSNVILYIALILMIGIIIIIILVCRATSSEEVTYSDEPLRDGL